MKTLLAPIFLFTFLISGCSGTSGARDPQFYPNEKLSQTDPSQVNEDARYCMSLADSYVQDPNHYQNVAKGTFKGAAIGTAAGAVGGAIVSNAGRGAGVGAATGAIVALINEIGKTSDPNPTWERFVEQCLADKGYRIYSWG